MNAKTATFMTDPEMTKEWFETIFVGGVLGILNFKKNT